MLLRVHSNRIDTHVRLPRNNKVKSSFVYLMQPLQGLFLYVYCLLLCLNLRTDPAAGCDKIQQAGMQMLVCMIDDIIIPLKGNIR